MWLNNGARGWGEGRGTSDGNLCTVLLKPSAPLCLKCALPVKSLHKPNDSRILLHERERESQEKKNVSRE